MRRSARWRRVAVTALWLGLCVATTAVGIAAAAGGQSTRTAIERAEPASLPAVLQPAELAIAGSFGPRVLSRHGQTPIRLDLRGQVRQAGALEGHPVAIREVQVESADLEVHTKGIPVCHLGVQEASETGTVEEECASALIGAGTATAQVAFAEQRPINVRGRSLVLNGGTRQGETTLFVHTFFPAPISGAIVTTITATDLPGGRFGTLAIAKIPEITGGAGSITEFHLTIDRNVAGHHPISATCADGKVGVYVESTFENGSKSSAEIVRSCGPPRS